MGEWTQSYHLPGLSIHTHHGDLPTCICVAHWQVGGMIIPIFRDWQESGGWEA